MGVLGHISRPSGCLGFNYGVGCLLSHAIDLPGVGRAAEVKFVDVAL
jgi:hypothetical protein